MQINDPTVASVATWIAGGALTFCAGLIWRLNGLVQSMRTEFRVWKAELDVVLYGHNSRGGLVSKVESIEVFMNHIGRIG